jgi:hypothetical protein
MSISTRVLNMHTDVDRDDIVQVFNANIYNKGITKYKQLKGKLYVRYNGKLHKLSKSVERSMAITVKYKRFNNMKLAEQKILDSL